MLDTIQKIRTSVDWVELYPSAEVFMEIRGYLSSLEEKARTMLDRQSRKIAEEIINQMITVTMTEEEAERLVLLNEGIGDRAIISDLAARVRAGMQKRKYWISASSEESAISDAIKMFEDEYGATPKDLDITTEHKKPAWIVTIRFPEDWMKGEENEIPGKYLQCGSQVQIVRPGKTQCPRCE